MSITEEQIQEFKETGLLVIDEVLTQDEVENARNNLHKQLLHFNIDHTSIINQEAKSKDLIKFYEPRLKSPASRIFYSKWKLLDVHLHNNVIKNMNTLLNATYNSNSKDFQHPFGKFNKSLCYVDRICYRLPDHIYSEGGLSLHLDRNPLDPYLLNSKTPLKKWRPIQAFVSLTDQYGGESGGLRVVKNFHKTIDDYFSKSSIIDKCEGGEFFRMHGHNYDSLHKECHPVNAPAGSLVLWDNKLPHETCDKLTSLDTREVVYVGFLPSVEINKKYVAEQLNAIKQNIPPPAYITDKKETSDRDWDEKDLNLDQKHCLGFL